MSSTSSTATYLRLNGIRLPEAAANTVMKALAKHPEERLASAGDFIETMGD